jgi:Zn-dependent protease
MSRLRAARHGCVTINCSVFGGGSSLQLFRLLGIRVGVHLSWFVVLFLWIVWLKGSFAASLTNANEGFAAAVIAAFLFFGSIVLHELGHALAARREGIEVLGIDLFFFGGYMKSSRDSDTPGEEFRVAAAGPAVNLLIAAVGTALGIALVGSGRFGDLALLHGTGRLIEVLIAFTVSINVVLLVFNLIPAFPLDGGRLARAVAWRLTGNRHGATRFAAGMGQAFAALLMGYGLYRAFGRSDATSGIWYLALGWMLGSAARAAVVQSAVATRLEGVTAADIMDAEPVTIPAGMSVAQAYEDFFLRYQGWPWFAVVEDDGRLAGIAHRAAVEQVAHEHGVLAVRSVTAAGEQVATDTPLESLAGSEPLRRLGALMAVDRDGRLRGVVTVEQVSRALQARLAPS